MRSRSFADSPFRRFAAAFAAATAVLALAASPALAKIEYVGAWGNGQLTGIGGIAVAPNGDVFLTEWEKNQIQKFTGAGRLIYTYQGTIYATDHQMDGPTAIAVDPEGAVWVETGLGLVKYHSTPTTLERIRGVGYAADALAVQPGPDSGDVYAANRRANHINALSSMGTFITFWESRATALATGPSGDIYVADSFDNRIKVISPSGQFVRKWGGSGDGPGKFDGYWGPAGIAVAADGSVYVTDPGNKRIEKFNSEGRFLLSWDSWGTLPVTVNLERPRYIAVGPGGLIYVYDYGDRQVDIFRDTEARGAGVPG